MDYELIRSRRRSISIEVTRDSAGSLPPFTGEEIADMTREAKLLIPGMVAEKAQEMGLSYNRVSIRHQRSRWGSCSSKGNLNFNCLLVKAPPEVTEYVVVHELAHLKEMNHSKAFWELVERYCPRYRQYRRWLRGEEGRA